ncbi:uncharacterized protein TRIVIDRAFT_186262 [Trichoderma virens Gv29-8]|uniref:Uncharacterized protein n=1 Tax=Hypocrea virens (strain Gv29-8 / FGSC 10586) TaxID=413071 RepID=G9MPD1_HYPVG|nr:uncharacterized protein TRIVIDRAFT_186262 [Trichoderma virens Gv29-8]EHK23733.1 hypothetical protein TRIVIDRAFT_186262 [Trichoderma virens Gv29-8]
MVAIAQTLVSGSESPRLSHSHQVHSRLSSSFSPNSSTNPRLGNARNVSFCSPFGGVHIVPRAIVRTAAPLGERVPDLAIAIA